MKRVVYFIGTFVFLLTTLILLSGCGGTSLSSNDVVYDGEYITWKEVSGTSHYELSINGGETIEVNNNEYNYSTEDTFTVKISTVPKSSFLTKSKTIEKTFTALAQVQNVLVENGKVTWDLVEGAERYKLQIGNTVVNDNIRVNSFDLRDSDVGTLTIRVIALKDGSSHFSKWSNSLYITILNKPENIQYLTDQTVKKLTWDAVNGASTYAVKINGGDEIIATSNYLEYEAEQKTFSVEVKAVGNQTSNTFDSKYSEAVEYIYLAPITTFDVVDGVLTWLPISKATSYKIKVGNNIFNTNECRYDGLNPGQSYNIEIFPQAEGENYYSQWSSTTPINILYSPDVTISDGNIIWNNISNATGYKVVIKKNGSIIYQQSTNAGISGSTHLAMGNHFDSPADYTVTVQSETNQSSYYGSKPSEPLSIKRLAAPSNKTITDNPLLKDATSVTFTDVQGASGYSVIYNDVEVQDITSTTFNIGVSDDTNTSENSTIKVSIRAKGSSNASQKKYVLDALETLDFNITRLGSPKNLTVDNGYIKWDSVPSAFGYIVTIDGTTTMEVVSTSTSLIVPTLTAKNHDITVRAKGNGSTHISSVYSNPFEVIKLAQPANLQIQQANNNNMLSWGMVSNCTGYAVNLSGRTETLNSNTNSVTINDSDISVDGTVITIQALGNGANIIDSDLSQTETLIRLKAPTNLSLINENVVWNAPSNVGSYSVSYRIFRGTSTNEVAVRNSETWSASNLVEGTNTLMVQAIGDGRTTFDSEISTAATFTKLTPVNLRVANDNLSFEWDIITGAEQYSYSLDGSTWINVDKTVSSFKPNFTTAGSKTVYIKALGSDVNGIASSNVTTYDLQVSTLPQIPLNTTNFSFDGTVLTVLVASYDNLVPAGATFSQGFDFIVGGVSNVQKNGTMEQNAEFTYTVSGTPTLKIKVIAKGNYFSLDGNTYYLDSLSAFEKTINILSAPSESSIGLSEVSISQKLYELYWDRSGSGVYNVIIEYLDSSYNVKGTEELNDTTSHSKNISITDETVRRIRVKIQKIGDGNTNFSSEWTEKVFILNS